MYNKVFSGFLDLDVSHNKPKCVTPQQHLLPSARLNPAVHVFQYAASQKFRYKADFSSELQQHHPPIHIRVHTHTPPSTQCSPHHPHHPASAPPPPRSPTPAARLTITHHRSTPHPSQRVMTPATQTRSRSSTAAAPNAATAVGEEATPPPAPSSVAEFNQPVRLFSFSPMICSGFLTCLSPFRPVIRSWFIASHSATIVGISSSPHTHHLIFAIHARSAALYYTPPFAAAVARHH